MASLTICSCDINICWETEKFFQENFYIQEKFKINHFRKTTLKRLKKKNDANALKQKAYLQYYIGTLIRKSNSKKAIKLFKILAERESDLECQYDLGKCYLNGVGVKKDSEKAKYWLNKAVEQGGEAAKENFLKGLFEG